MYSKSWGACGAEGAVVIAAAIALAACGFAVLPIGADKRPRCVGGCYGASSDPLVVERLFANAPGAGVAIATGSASGVDVLDIDPRNGGDSWLAANTALVPRTLMHGTPRGGWHVVLRHAEGMGCPGTLSRYGVDVKGDGGYVGWPPTAGYWVARDAPVAEWPEGLLALVRSQSEGSIHRRAFKLGDLRETLKAYPQTVPRWSPEESYALVALNNQYQRLSTAVPGTRGNELYRSAAGLGQLVAVGWISAENVVSMLCWACEANKLVAKDGPDRVLRELFRGLEAGLSQPHPGLRYRSAVEGEAGGCFLLTERLNDQH